MKEDIVYDRTKTVLDRNSIKQLVRNTIIGYIDNDLEKFDKDLYFSKITRLMDETSDSIVGNDTTIGLQRRFVPTLGIVANYKIDFGNPIYHPHSGHIPVVTTSGFKYKDNLNDEITAYLEDDGSGKIQLFKFDAFRNKVLVYSDRTAVGTIDYDTGVIELNDFRPISFINDSSIKINVPLQNKNIFATRSRILTIDSFDPSSVVLSIRDITESRPISSKAISGSSTTSSTSLDTGTSSSSPQSGTSSSSSTSSGY